MGLPIVYNQWIRKACVGDLYKDQVVIARRLARLKLSHAHRIAFIRLALHWRRLARARDIVFTASVAEPRGRDLGISDRF